ncbi:GerMN domain-containing protein [Janibacter massiliensis]|uniref:GerMN domain-containing protein n=1 Tax=Janibacter massiliensis TaxID=2058291 RepID=UPI000D112949|nr:GerMN domain-containing protein [Janibacter massiliensis]
MSGVGRVRRAVLGVVVAATVAVLPGCGGLATSSPVRQGLPVDPPAERQPRAVLAGPTDGESKAEVVRGFLRAGAATGSDVDVAREYLTPQADRGWIPDSGTVVYEEGSLRIVPLPGNRARLRIDVLATIDAEGRLVESPPLTYLRTEVQLVRDGERWRLQGLEKGFGRWLTPAETQRVFQRVSIHHAATNQDVLIPEERWLPDDRIVTRLVQAQLSVPTREFTGAIRDVGDPDLSIEAIPVEDGIASVDLTPASRPGDPDTRRVIYAELVATLQSAPGVDGVRLTSDGAALDVPGTSLPVRTVGEVGFTTQATGATAAPLVRQGDRLYRTAASGIGDRASDRRLAPFPRIPLAWGPLSLSADGRDLAATTRDRTQLARWRGRTALEVSTPGTELTRPVFDIQGVLWFGGVARDGRPGLWAVNATAAPGSPGARAYRVKVPWLAGRRIAHVAPSALGQRVLVVTTRADGSDPQLVVSGVIRRPNGLPQALSPQARRLAARVTSVRDVSWVGPTQVAILGSLHPARAVGVLLAEVGGFTAAPPTRALSSLRGLRQVSSIGGVRGLVVSTDSGTFQRAGGAWFEIDEADEVLVPLS